MKSVEKILVIGIVMLILLLTPAAWAGTINYDDTVPASGIPTEGWNTSTLPADQVIGLIAYDRSTFSVPNVGDGSYTFPVGPDPGSPGLASWDIGIWIWGFTSGQSFILSIVGPGVDANLQIDVDWRNFAGTQESLNIFTFGGDPNAAGDYVIGLASYTSTGTMRNDVGITVHVLPPVSTPDGGQTFALLGFVLVGLGGLRKRV